MSVYNQIDVFGDIIALDLGIIHPTVANAALHEHLPRVGGGAACGVAGAAVGVVAVARAGYRDGYGRARVAWRPAVPGCQRYRRR